MGFGLKLIFQEKTSLLFYINLSLNSSLSNLYHQLSHRVSSANKFGFDDKLSGKSLMHFMKSNGTSMEPLGIHLSLTHNQPVIGTQPRYDATGDLQVKHDGICR